MSKHPSKRNAAHSRTDRFTQMSKQEEIIAEKKRLIEAKLKMIQSQEKTETQQSSTVNKNAITAKQAVINSFSNDGSFLENFKKISGPADAVVNESKVDKQQSNKIDRSFNVQDNYEGFQNNSHWNHHKREDDNSRNYDHNSYHSQHKSHSQNMHQKPLYESGYSYENQNYQRNFNAQNNQRNTAFGNTCTPNYQMNQNIQNGRLKNVDNMTNLSSSFPPYSDNMRNMSSWQGPNENSMSRISDFNNAAISGREEMSQQKPAQIPALTSLQIPPPKIAPETNVKIPPPVIKPDLSVPPPVPFSLLSIPEPKPIDTTSIPRPGPLNLHTIPPPMPMCINNIPKPKEIDVRTIPPPKQFNISGINLPSTTYHGNVFYGKNDTVLSTDNPMSRNQGSNHHDSNQMNQQNPERNPIERVAKLIVEIGDGYEEIFKQKHQHEPEFWFLFRQDSAEYSKLKELVRKLKEEKIEKNSYSPEELYEPEFSLNDDDDDFSSETSSQNIKNETSKQTTFKKSLVSSCYDDVTEPAEENSGKTDETNNESEESRRKRKRKSRWGNEEGNVAATGLQNFTKSPGATIISLPPDVAPVTLPLPQTQINKITRTDRGLLQYAKNTFGTTNLSEEDWIKAEDHYKINLLYQEMLRKRKELDQLSRSGKHKYEYDSDEEIDGGTWEHKLRSQEMEATQKWADELTKKSEGKHHIGDFLPPEELKKFMEKYSAAKNGREPDISDYKEYKLNENNVGFQMLQKLGWKDGEGLGSSGSGIVEPINKASNRESNQGLGLDRPDNILTEDNEYDAYRKRMMLAYRFRPNPLNNPRRPYY